MMHEANEGQAPADRPGHHRLLPIAGGSVVVAAMLAHLGGGALLMHVGLPALLVSLGLGGAFNNLGSGAIVLGIVAVVAVKLLVVFGARHVSRRK